MWRKRWLLLAALCATPLAVHADDDHHYPPCPMGSGMGPGMTMGGMGMGPGMMMGMGPVHMLDLNDEQRAKLNKLMDDERRQHWTTMGQMMDLQSRMRDLYGADKRDVQAILKVEDQMQQLRRKMLESHLNTENQVEALLTKEQREQLRKLRRNPGAMCGMGPGMMGPGGYGPRGMMEH